MLTRENFKNTWARPKEEKKTQQENMVVDRPTTKAKSKTGVSQGDEMAIDDRPALKVNKKIWNEQVEKTVVEQHRDTTMEGVETPSEEDVMKDGKMIGRLNNERSWMAIKMPIFAFQRHGIRAIGDVKCKSHYRTPNSKH